MHIYIYIYIERERDRERERERERERHAYARRPRGVVLLFAMCVIMSCMFVLIYDTVLFVVVSVCYLYLCCYVYHFAICFYNVSCIYFVILLFLSYVSFCYVSLQVGGVVCAFRTNRRTRACAGTADLRTKIVYFRWFASRS